MAVSPIYGGGVSGADYEPTTITELGGMIGKIAYSVIRENTANDALAVFDKMPVNKGDTIEEAVVQMAESLAYDEDGEDALKREDSVKFAVKYFKNWTRKKFKKTVDVPQLRKVLEKDIDVADVTSKIVSSMTEGDKHEKYLNVRDLLAWGRQSADGGTGAVLVRAETVNYDTTNNAIDYKGLLVAMRDAFSGMKFVNTSFNSISLKRRTREEDIYVLIPYTLKNRIDINDLASAFNLDKTDIKGRIIEIDSASVGGYDYVYIVDKHAILDFTRLYEMMDEKNADGLFWNYYLHTDRLYALSPLFDACYIKVQTSAPTQAQVGN